MCCTFSRKFISHTFWNEPWTTEELLVVGFTPFIGVSFCFRRSSSSNVLSVLAFNSFTHFSPFCIPRVVKTMYRRIQPTDFKTEIEWMRDKNPLKTRSVFWSSEKNHKWLLHLYHIVCAAAIVCPPRRRWVEFVIIVDPFRIATITSYSCFFYCYCSSTNYSVRCLMIAFCVSHEECNLFPSAWSQIVALSRQVNGHCGGGVTYL